MSKSKILSYILIIILLILNPLSMISSLAISRSVCGIKCYNKLSQPLYSIKYVNQSNYNETLNNPEDEPEPSVGIGEPPIPEPAILVSVIIITVVAMTVLMYSRRGIIKL